MPVKENRLISHKTSVESNTQAEDGKVVKIFTKAGTKERKKLKTKKNNTEQDSTLGVPISLI